MNRKGFNRYFMVILVISILLSSTLILFQEDLTGNAIYIPEGCYPSQDWQNLEGENRLSKPENLAIDSQNNIYILDSYPSRPKLYKFNSEGRLLKKYGSYGSNYFQFRDLNGITIDSQNNIYIIDSGNEKIMKFDSNLNLLKTVNNYTVDGELKHLQSYTIAQRNNYIYVATTSPFTILKFDLDLNFIEKYEYPEINAYAFDMGFDGNGNLYILEFWNKKIMKFDSNLRYIKSFGNTGSEKLVHSWGIDVDNSGNVYATEEDGNGMIKVFNSDGIYKKTINLFKLNEDMIHIDIYDVAIGIDGEIYFTDIFTTIYYPDPKNDPHRSIAYYNILRKLKCTKGVTPARTYKLAQNNNQEVNSNTQSSNTNTQSSRSSRGSSTISSNSQSRNSNTQSTSSGSSQTKLRITNTKAFAGHTDNCGVGSKGCTTDREDTEITNGDWLKFELHTNLPTKECFVTKVKDEHYNKISKGTRNIDRIAHVIGRDEDDGKGLRLDKGSDTQFNILFRGDRTDSGVFSGEYWYKNGAYSLEKTFDSNKGYDTVIIRCTNKNNNDITETKIKRNNKQGWLSLFCHPEDSEEDCND